DVWKARNSLGGDISIGGHSFELFNFTHKPELTAHPEYLAEVGGKRQPFANGTKPCISNPGFRALYIADRVGTMKGMLDRDPNSPQAFGVSVEPSDGGGYCECAECKKLGSASDQVFFLANEVAKVVAAKLPGRHVSLYAYGEHAGVPNIPLEPNVFV